MIKRWKLGQFGAYCFIHVVLTFGNNLFKQILLMSNECLVINFQPWRSISVRTWHICNYIYKVCLFCKRGWIYISVEILFLFSDTHMLQKTQCRKSVSGLKGRQVRCTRGLQVMEWWLIHLEKQRSWLYDSVWSVWVTIKDKTMCKKEKG